MMPTRVNAPCFFFVSFLLIQSFSTFVLLEIYVSEVCSVPTTGYKNISLVSLVRGYDVDILVEIPFFFLFFFSPKAFPIYRRERFRFSSLFVREIEIGRKLWEKRENERTSLLFL